MIVSAFGYVAEIILALIVLVPAESQPNHWKVYPKVCPKSHMEEATSSSYAQVSWSLSNESKYLERSPLDFDQLYDVRPRGW